MFLFINKPPGPTSHDIINQLRRVTGLKTIGHAGTLDPFASGLLIVGVGRESTKRLGEFQKLDKTYRAMLKLGAVSDTYDRTGRITVTAKTPPIPPLSKGRTTYYPLLDKEGLGEVRGNTLEDVLLRFEGPQLQIPPMFSAKKVNGKKLYEFARKGRKVDRKPVWIMVYKIEVSNPALSVIPDLIGDPETNKKQKEFLSVLDSRLPLGHELEAEWRGNDMLELTVRCSSGTYIRSLAHDIGQVLGCGAYLEQLERISIGSYELKKALNIKTVTTENWKSYAQSLDPSSVASHKSSVLVFGTFDNLHPGHIDFFQQALLSFAEQNFGGQARQNKETRYKIQDIKLVVGIARDTIVEKIKGRSPHQNELTRLKAVRACSDVTAAYLLPENPDHRWDWIKKICPSLIFLGYDQTTYTEKLETELRAHNITCPVKRGTAYKPEQYKSSLINGDA